MNESSQNLGATTRDNPATLRRALGPGVAIAVVVGNVIGSGIFLKPATIAKDGGNFWLIIGIWVAGGLLCFLGALCYAELAAMLPRAGGLYVYLREAYGRPVAFLFGWTDFLFRLPGSVAALAYVFSQQLFFLLGWQASAPLVVSMCVVVIAGMAAVNIAGVAWGGRMQLATTLVKAVALALIALSPFLLYPLVGRGVETANYATTVAPANPALASQIAAVLLAVLWAYNGWHGVTPLAEEIRHPQRNIPLALLGGLTLLVLLYVAANFAYHGVLPMNEMRQIAVDAENSKRQVDQVTAASEMLSRLVGPPGVSIMAAVIMCSVFGAINTNFLQAPRIPFAMGRDGVFFRALGQVHATYRTPAVAIIVSALMSILLIIAAATGKYLARGVDPAEFDSEFIKSIVTNLKQGTVFNTLTGFVIFAISWFYMLAALAVVVLRFRRPDLERPYRTHGYPVVPILFVLVYVWFLTQLYWIYPIETGIGTMLILLGVPAYFAYGWWTKGSRETDAPDAPRD